MRRPIIALVSMLCVGGFGNSALAQYDEDFDEGVHQTAPEQPPPQGQAAPPTQQQPAEPSVDFQTFHQALSPYGKWIYTAEYGWVWSPDGVDQNWQPYQDGEWVWTAYGWTWSGNEAWAWGPYHYGSWVYFDWGWGWVPGYVWGPAWVSWRWGDDYVGWTPLYPGWGYGVAWGVGWPIYYNQWCFVGYNNFYATPINHATVLPPGYVQDTVWGSTHSVSAVRVNGVNQVGPPPSQVEAITRHPVRAVTIRPISSVAQGASIHGLHDGVFNAVAPSFRGAPQTLADSSGRLPSEIPGNRALGAQPIMTAQKQAAASPSAYRGALPGDAASRHFTTNGPAGARVAQAPGAVPHAVQPMPQGGYRTGPQAPAYGAHPNYGLPNYAHPGYGGGGYHPPLSYHPSMSGVRPSYGGSHPSGGGAVHGGGGGHAAGGGHH
jgi:hypothetical protein